MLVLTTLSWKLCSSSSQRARVEQKSKGLGYTRALGHSPRDYLPRVRGGTGSSYAKQKDSASDQSWSSLIFPYAYPLRSKEVFDEKRLGKCLCIFPPLWFSNVQGIMEAVRVVLQMDTELAWPQLSLSPLCVQYPHFFSWEMGRVTGRVFCKVLCIFIEEKCLVLAEKW